MDVHKERNIVFFKNNVKSSTVILLVAADNRDIAVSASLFYNKPLYSARDKLTLIVKISGAVYGYVPRLIFARLKMAAKDILLKSGNSLIFKTRRAG